MTSWKTTGTGLAAVLSGISALVSALTGIGSDTPPDYQTIVTAISAIIAGFGLMFARDNTVTSEQAGAK